MRALEPWVEGPLQTFLDESSARLTLLMTSSGQVVAQHGFSRYVLVKGNASYDNPIGSVNLAWPDWEDDVRRCHEVVHEMGAPRVSATVKLSPRSDRNQSLQEKVESVQNKL